MIVETAVFDVTAGENDAQKKPAQDQAVKPASKKLADSVAVSAAEAGKRVQADC